MKLNEKVIVVTGAGSGIGAELVISLLLRGAFVAAVDLKEEGLKNVQQRIGEKQDKFNWICLDISDKEKVEKLPRLVIEKFGQVDGLINCAGIIQPFKKINDLDYDAINRVMNVNFYGMLFITKVFLPLLLKRPAAHIVNVSSMGGFLPVPGQSVYGASKSAMKLFTEGLYAELLDTTVRVTLVYPGATSTNIAENSNVKVPKNTGAEVKSMSPQKVARIILRGVEKDKAQIFTGLDSKTMNFLYRLAPVFATKFIAKKMKSLLN